MKTEQPSTEGVWALPVGHAAIPVLEKFNKHFFTDGGKFAYIGVNEYRALVFAINPPPAAYSAPEPADDVALKRAEYNGFIRAAELLEAYGPEPVWQLANQHRAELESPFMKQPSTKAVVDTDYVCPQCGPDSRGGEAHAKAMHTIEGLFREQPGNGMVK